MFDFPTTVDDISAVPAEFQGLYAQTEDGEGFAINEILAKKISDTGNLTTTLGKLRKEVADSKKALSGYTAIAKTPAELSAMIDGYRSIAETPEALTELLAEQAKLLESKDPSKAVEQVKTAQAAELKKLTDKFTGDLAEKEKIVSRLRKTLDSEMIESALIAEISKQKGSIDLLLPVAMRFVRVAEDESGNFVRQVVDKDGDQRINAKGEPMSIGEFISEMRSNDAFARAFDGEGRQGSGSETGGRSTPNPKAKTYTLKAWQELVASAKPDERKKLLQEKAAGKYVVR